MLALHCNLQRNEWYCWLAKQTCDFYILDFDDGPGNEAFTSVTTTAGAWSEHEVKLNDFNTIEAFDGTLRQLKITRNEANNAANISYLYLTNIYFYTDQTLTTVDRNLGIAKFVSFSVP